jgi:hypothetical protein
MIKPMTVHSEANMQHGLPKRRGRYNYPYGMDILSNTLYEMASYLSIHIQAAQGTIEPAGTLSICTSFS